MKIEILIKVLRTSLYYIIACCVGSCTNTPGSGKFIENIDLFTAYTQSTLVPVSEVASGIEYIRLETSEDCMLSNPHLINVRDSLIICIGFRKLYLFSRSTGRFLYEVSNYGRGPGEYISTTDIYDNCRDLFYVCVKKSKDNQFSSRTYGAYNLNGNIEKYVNLPSSVFEDNYIFNIIRFYPIDDSLYIGYVNNHMGNTPQRLVVFSQNGEILKSYPNYNIIDMSKYESVNQDLYKAMFFRINNTTRFYELHTDTIFSVDRNNIIPKFYFEMGNYRLPYNIQAVKSSLKSDYQNYFHIRTMFESERFLLFTVGLNGFRHLAYYDKIEKSTKVCNMFDDLGFYHYVDYWGARCIGFNNDIDNFVPIGTSINFFINTENEYIAAIPALEVKRWFDRNPEKAKKLPEHLQAFRDINAEDNPVIVVAKLKK